MLNGTLPIGFCRVKFEVLDVKDMCSTYRFSSKIIIEPTTLVESFEQ